MTSWQEGADPAAAFASAYQREFGFVLERPVVVDDVRVRATGRAADLPHIQVRHTHTHTGAEPGGSAWGALLGRGVLCAESRG